MMRVLIADDHPVVRRGVRQTLTDEFADCEVVEAQTAAELMSLVRAGEWSVVVLDVSLPDRNGLDVLKELRSDHPTLPIVILSMHPEDQFAARMLRAGASAYVAKESASEDLTVAIRSAVAGRRYMSPGLTQRLALEALLEEGSKSLPISDREMQVLCLIAEGKSLTEIADALILSVKTVSTYRARLLEKLNVETTADLVHFAFSQGFVKK
jgi:two-component system invasion response regulator UvrY